MELRNSSINARRVAKQLPIKIRPSDNSLYRYFEGIKKELSERQKEEMLKIVERDYKEFVAALSS